jgi:hypothetical protein
MMTTCVCCGFSSAYADIYLEHVCSVKRELTGAEKAVDAAWELQYDLSKGRLNK